MTPNATAIHFPLTEPTTNRDMNLRFYIGNKKAYFLCKRISDVVISILVIVCILSWLVPIVGLLILLNTKGPVFFIQKRVGEKGKSFNCYKFRTMIVNAEADQKQAEENDARITKLGRILRKCNIDELPQFLNVLLGHMSIVGPRPHMYTDCYKFSQVVGSYKLRTFVKPGITGMAQSKGFHGPASDYERIYRRYEWDIYYIRNASFLLDVKIIVDTAAQRFNCAINAMLNKLD